MPSLPTAVLIARSVPSTGVKENVRGLAVYDDTEGTGADGDAKLATLVLFPALVWKVGHQLAAAHENAEFPDDGTGVLPTTPLGAGTNTLKLASTALQTGAAGLDPRSLLVQMVDGPAAGHYRKITGWTGGTQTLALSRAWDGAALPVVGNRYRLLIDCRYRSLFTLSGEYSASGIAAQFRIVFYDWALDGAGVLRKPRRIYDQARTLMAAGVQITAGEDIETASRWVSEALTIQSKGFLGAKVRMTNAPGVGNVDLFATTT